ncbi:glycosyltransferase family 25 protein [Paracoccus sp. P2]|uniref:glycosyltransferase family 25 protein n=1 Tax=Paracoccus sp. P2 TaxID=3248840 RepID=UPI00391FC84C
MAMISVPLIITIEDENGPRRHHARQEAERQGWTPLFLRSIDTTSPEISRLYDSKWNRRKRKRPMTAGEIACYYGHRQAWQVVAAGKEPARLILEDDFKVARPDLIPLFSQAVDQLPAWDIICLSSHRAKGPFRSLYYEGIAFRKYLFGATGAVGYLLSQNGARKLLSRSKVFRPLDEDFIHPWELGLTVRYTAPRLICEMNDAVSTLEDARKNRKRRLLGRL